jgi:hypothetical protein
MFYIDAHALLRPFAHITLIDTTVAWWLMLGIEASRGNKARRLLSMILAMRRSSAWVGYKRRGRWGLDAEWSHPSELSSQNAVTRSELYSFRVVAMSSLCWHPVRD